MADVQNDLPSVAFFNPQSKPAEVGYLNLLHDYLVGNKTLRPFVESIKSLDHTWQGLVKYQAALAGLQQGPASMKALTEWVTTGDSSTVAAMPSSCLTLPLLTIIQTCQYFQFLELRNVTHSQLLQSFRNGGGVHGYCGGLLVAASIALSTNEAELAENASKALRLSLLLGGYGDLGDVDPDGGPTNLVIRLKDGHDAEDLVGRFPGAYISAITDPKTISVVGPADVLESLQKFAKARGLQSQGVFIRGKFHSPENHALALNLTKYCLLKDKSDFPTTSRLQVPFRSNSTGDLMADGSITSEVIETILASQCRWDKLLEGVAADLKKTGRRRHPVINFGIGDCCSPLPFHACGLSIAKLDAMSITQAPRKEVRSSQDAPYDYPPDAIAVVGMACHYPRAKNVEQLWSIIASGESTVQKIPKHRVNAERDYRLRQDSHSKNREFYGNFLDKPGTFDHAFFRISAREAVNLDPQQRLVLETAYQAVESSGSYLRSHKQGNGDDVGVFVGASFVEYLGNTSSHPPTAYTSTGTIRAFLSGRISHYFGWTGPAEVIDTACSSSLVAINRACKAIQTGECSMALAGGVNVITSLQNYIDLGKAGFLSPSGQCKPFDADADGYCRSEGVGLVFLKPLNHALRDKDRVIGVVAGTGTNQGGLSPSLTVPHSPTLAALYRKILSQADMPPHHVSYVEAHGTGTQAGDPVEMASIREVLGGSERGTLLHVGSIKGNIGHCETAAGVAGFIKALLMLQKGMIPPLASHEKLNPKIPWLADDRLAIATTDEAWDARYRTVLVNSYGAAGSNAAMLLCEPPHSIPLQATDSADTAQAHGLPILLSAASESSLRAYARDLQVFLCEVKPNLAHVAYTLATKRLHHRFRCVIKLQQENLVASTTNPAQGSIGEVSETPQIPRSIILVFCGQVSPVIGVPRALYDTSPLFRSHIDRCDAIARRMDVKIVPIIFQSEPILDLQVLHCCLFTKQYAFAQCWIDSGLEVAAVVGQSFGELVALTVAGVLSLEDGMKLVQARAGLIESRWTDTGRMLSLRCSLDEANDIVEAIGNGVEIACYNAGNSFVLGGTHKSIEAVEDLLRHDINYSHVKSQRLQISHAYHTRLAEGIMADLQSTARCLYFRKPCIRLETCMRDHQIEIGPDHTSRHVRDPVYFNNAIKRLEARFGDSVWLEAGCDSPSFALVNRAVATPTKHEFLAVRLQVDDTLGAIAAIAADLWRIGVSVDHWGYHENAGHGLQQVWLPPYHFEENDHWLPYVDHATDLQKKLETMSSHTKPDESTTSGGTGLVARLETGDHSTGAFRINTRSRRFQDIVTGHAVLGRPLCPAGLYLECISAAFNFDHQEGCEFVFQDCSFEAPLGTALDNDVRIRLCKSGKNADFWAFEVSSSTTTTKSVMHACGSLARGGASEISYQRLVSRRIQEMNGMNDLELLRKDRAYGVFSRVVKYSDMLKGISTIRFADTEALAQIDTPVLSVQESQAQINGAQAYGAIALDVFIQVCGLLINSHSMCLEDSAYVAVGATSIRIDQDCHFSKARKWTVYAVFEQSENGKAKGDVFAQRPDGNMAVVMAGLRFQKVALTTLGRLLDTANEDTRSGKAVNAVDQSTDIMLPAPESKSRDFPHEPSTKIETAVESNVYGRLCEIVAPYLGLDPRNLPESTSLGELGIDSLAAIELADDLGSKFKILEAGIDLLTLDIKALCALLKTKNPSMTPQTTSAPKISDVRGPSPDQAGTISGSCDLDAEIPLRLVTLIAEHSGCPVAAIADKASLADFGIDSLALIELKADLQARFAAAEKVDDIHTGTRVQELLGLFGILSSQSSGSAAQQSTPETPSRSSSRSRDLLRLESRGVLEIDPSDILTNCDASFLDSAAATGFSNYWDVVSTEQDQIVIVYIAEAFKRIGIDLWLLQEDEPVPVFDFASKQSRLVERLWHILQRHGIIYRQGKEVRRSATPIPCTPSSELIEHTNRKHSLYQVESDLLALTGPKLAGCLSGSEDPLKLLFGTPGARDTMSAYYHDSPMLSTMTHQLLKFIKGVVQTVDSNTGIKIFEIGAGFGGTTTPLLEMLQEVDQEIQYKFTDISSTLVDMARKRFARYEWIEFGTLDLEKDPPVSMQDKYDIVIATNVVHATTNLVLSLRRMKSLLRDGGFVCLSEVTQTIDWYDLVFGLLPGWWCFNDGRKYALQPAEHWIDVLKQAGFESTMYSDGPSREAKSQRLIIGSTKPSTHTAAPNANAGLRKVWHDNVKTVVYRKIDGLQIHADIYLPKKDARATKPMPIALMIHGGGYMTLSRRAIRPLQTEFLLNHGVLPVSLDHRLCPQVTLPNGPMKDICHAVSWARNALPELVRDVGIEVDTTHLAVIGWSTGGHLAMSTAWTTVEDGVRPPDVILNFYGPTDFESLVGSLGRRERVEGEMTMEEIRSELPHKIVTGHDPRPSHETAGELSWLQKGDPRSELVLKLFTENYGINILLNGIEAQDLEAMVEKDRIEALSPLARVRKNEYRVPAFTVVGEDDRVVGLDGITAFHASLEEKGIVNGLVIIQGAGHCFDLYVGEGSELWARGLSEAYTFLLKKLGL